MIQHDHLDGICYRFFIFVKIRDFNFNIQVFWFGIFQCRIQGFFQSSRPSYMIFFYQDHVIQGVTVIVSPTAGHGIFIQYAKIRHGLSRIENSTFCSLDLFNKRWCQGGNAWHASHNVQCRPFGREYGPAFPFYREDHIAFYKSVAIIFQTVNSQVFII